MIILTKEILQDTNKLSELIEKEKELVNISIEEQKNHKNILVDSMQRLGDSTSEVENDASSKIVELLESNKKSLELSRNNLTLLDGILATLDNILKINSEQFEEEINVLNTTIQENTKTVLNNNLEIEKTIKTTLALSKFTFLKEEKVEVSEEIKTEDSTTPLAEEATSNNTVEKVDEKPDVKEESKPVLNMEVAENTLIISEQHKKVFLPYYASVVNDLLTLNKGKYANVNDVIEQEYTLPIKMFKNSAFARFREAYKLVKHKAHGNFKDAFDLALELFFYYNLHPAIITACRNLDELDYYLDCLENNETHKFDCFKIIFDMTPLAVKE